MVFAIGTSFGAVKDGLLPIALLPIAMSTRMIGEQTIAAVDLLKRRSFLQWSTAAVAVAANVWLIPGHGWVAAAWVCFVAEAFLGSCYGYLTLQLHRQTRRAKRAAA
jgi:O-antigen/teichoic acid export membrane protein